LRFYQLSLILCDSIAAKGYLKKRMDNDKQQQSQLPPQWVYDQEQPPASPAGPLHAYNNPPPENNQQFPPAPSPYDYDPNLTMDMGNSLGYGQTMDFHASSMPQPTTSIPRIREKRFKELREKRTRNKPVRGYPDVEALQQRKASGLLANDSTLIPGKTIIGSLFGRGRAAKREVRPGTLEGWSASGVYGAPGVGDPNARPNGAPTNGPAMAQPYLASPSVQANGVLVAASAGAQDTGMIQRVKVARAAFLITGAFMFSSILGLVRTFLFSYVFGAGGISDAYLNAYVIPNLLYTVVAGGALSSAFIPVFTRYAEGLKDEKSAWHIASSALNLSVIVMIVFSIIAMILSPVLVPLYAPVSKSFSLADQILAITLTRIMLLQAIVLGSGVIVSSVLNAKQDFTRTAIGTILYNAGLIIGLLPGFFLSIHARGANISTIAIYSATWSVVLAAILQVSVQIPGLFKVKMRYTFSFDWRHPGVRQIGRQMVPRAINAAMLSFSTVVDRDLLSFLGGVVSTQVVQGLTTDYIQAFSILVLPVSIFGSSVSTAAFPALASYVARERFDRVRSTIMETLRSILFLSIPSCVGLIILALPIIQVLLEHGQFTLKDAQFTAVPLTCFAVGLPALAAVEILTRAFYALRDSKTPVVISVAQFVLKIALSIVLINFSVFGIQWGLAALAFSTSVASIIEAVALFIVLSRRVGGFDIRALANFLGRALVASLGMGVTLFIVRNILDRMINTTTSYTLSVSGIFHALLKLLIELGIGSLVFLIIARRLNIEEMESGPVRKILNRLHVAWL
jgi:putative peptidoglycan lipid II flippase